MKYDYNDKPLPSSYPRGSNSGGSSGVGDSSGDENSYGEEVVQLQRRRQRTPPPPLNTFVDKVADKVYQQTHLLGEGSYGYVHVAVDENGDKVALKTFKIFDINDADVEQERRACMTIREHQPHHPNTLDSLLEARNTLQEHEVRYFGQQLVAGVAHLHSLGLVHCDLKPLNLLLTEDLVLKVGDFSQAQDLKRKQEAPVSRYDYDMYDGVVGSLGFQSPEVLKRERLTSALDIFSIGAILFRMLLGITYKVSGEIPEGRTKPVQAYAKMSANARDLLQRTLEYEPNNRIKMPDLLAHPFLINGPVPQSLSWDILKKVAPLATEDNAAHTDDDCQGEISKLREEEAAETLEEEAVKEEEAMKEEEVPSAQVNVAEGQLEVAQTQEEGDAQAHEEEAEHSEPAVPEVDLDEVDLDDIFAEVEEAKLARSIAADRALKQKGNKDVAVCGGKKVWDDDSEDEEEEVKGRKKVKVMQKGAVSENKAAEDKEGDHGGDQDAWPTHLFNL
ncbi:kinase-like domain-containing protein [Linnemannia elongata]|nr:kinase-like domain-containing protein [Linnemannia elongata]